MLIMKYLKVTTSVLLIIALAVLSQLTNMKISIIFDYGHQEYCIFSSIVFKF